MRLFVAVEISKDVREKINEFIFKNYHLLGKNKFSWVKKDNLHITLKFLGETKDSLVSNIVEELSFVVSKLKKFKVEIRDIGVFPEISFIKVLWLGVKENNQELSLLAKDVDDRMSKLGFKKETRPFVSHLTIARAKSIKDIEKIKHFIQKFCRLNFGIFEVNSVTLYESILSPQGPKYNVMKKFDLSN